MAQRFSFFVGMLACCGMSLGCSSHEMTGRVVVIPHRISGPLWLSEHVGISEAAERGNLKAAWYGPNDEGSLDEQSNILERAIQEGAAGIILSPNVYQVFKRDLLRAHDHGVPVVLEEEAADIDPIPGVSFVLSNQQETGRLAATRLGAILAHRGEVLIVGLDPHMPGSVERSDAIVASLEKYEPGIQILDRMLGSNSPAHSQMLIAETLQAHPHVSAILALSSGETVAAASAVRSSGRLNDIQIVGCDQNQSALMLLHLGVLDSLIVQDNRRMGSLAMETIAKMRSGRDNSQTIYVNPVLVTWDNINTESVQQLLLMHR